jgi:protein gp37
MEASKISWTDATFNPWRGCVKIAPECANCYADTLSGRNPKALGIWGNEKSGGTRVVAAESYWRGPVKWNKLAAAGKLPDGSPNEDGHRPRVFCASLADVFEEWTGPMMSTKGERLHWPHNSWQQDDVWIGEPECGGGELPVTMPQVRERLFRLIDATPHLDWMLLTKRPENVRKMWSPLNFTTTAEFKPATRHNVWLGTTAGLQETADKNVPKLLECSDLSPCLWVSCEPTLGPVDFKAIRLPNGDMLDALNGETCSHESGCLAVDDGPFLRWIITGGESGHGARPCHPDWVRKVRDDCQAAGAAFHHKQFSQADMNGFKDFDAFPDDLKIRDFPEVQHA